MPTLLSEGGFATWFLLAFGLSTLLWGAHFARTPSRRTLRITLALGGATVFATLTGVAANLAGVGHKAPALVKSLPGATLSDAVLQGIAESLSSAVLGFTMLSLTGLLVALGLYREVTE